MGTPMASQMDCYLGTPPTLEGPGASLSQFSQVENMMEEKRRKVQMVYVGMAPAVLQVVDDTLANWLLRHARTSPQIIPKVVEVFNAKESALIGLASPLRKPAAVFQALLKQVLQDYQVPF